MKITDKLEFDVFTQGETPQKAIVTIHGWKGNRTSFQQVCRSMKMKNVQWFFPEAPYRVDGVERQRSWSYEISPGIWEMDEPRNLFNQFFDEHIWPHYAPGDVYVMGFSQGGLMCLEYILQMDKPMGGVFPIATTIPTDFCSILMWTVRDFTPVRRRPPSSSGMAGMTTSCHWQHQKRQWISSAGRAPM